MATRELYHGSEAGKLLFNLQKGGITANDKGEIFFAEYEWQNCLVHGTDSLTGEAYVAKYRVEIPDGMQLITKPTSGNRDARILMLPPGGFVRAELLELYVRTGTRDTGFNVEQIKDKATALKVLQAKGAKAEAMKKVIEGFEKLKSQVELYSSEHQIQLNLSNESFAGFVTNALFNSDKPQMVIWGNAFGRLAAVQRHIKNRDLAKATTELMIARLWFLFALKKYSAWKDGIDGAGTKMQIAIVVTAVVLITAAVTAYVATAAAATGAATGSTTAAEQTIARIVTSCTRAEQVIQTANNEIEMLRAIEEAEQLAEPGFSAAAGG